MRRHVGPEYDILSDCATIYSRMVYEYVGTLFFFFFSSRRLGVWLNG